MSVSSGRPSTSKWAPLISLYEKNGFMRHELSKICLLLYLIFCKKNVKRNHCLPTKIFEGYSFDRKFSGLRLRRWCIGMRSVLTKMLFLKKIDRFSAKKCRRLKFSDGTALGFEQARKIGILGDYSLVPIRRSSELCP